VKDLLPSCCVFSSSQFVASVGCFRLQNRPGQRYAQLMLANDVKVGGLTVLSRILVYGLFVALFIWRIYRARVSAAMRDWAYGVVHNCDQPGPSPPSSTSSSDRENLNSGGIGPDRRVRRANLCEE
jgi:hypothetical protein